MLRYTGGYEPAQNTRIYSFGTGWTDTRASAVNAAAGPLSMLLPRHRSQQGSAITRYQRRRSTQVNDMIPSFALSVLRGYA